MNFLIEGVSGSGKTSVCTELVRRGYQAIHGDRALAYVGDPETGDPIPDNVTPEGHAANCACWDCLAWLSERWLWDLDQVRTIASDGDQPMTFYCGVRETSRRSSTCSMLCSCSMLILIPCCGG